MYQWDHTLAYMAPQHRQNSPTDLNNSSLQSESARSSGDTIGASKGTIARSENTTLRDIYEAQGRVKRGSGDSYGFPAACSTSSSMSSLESYPLYLGDSSNSSISDNTNSASNIESISPWTLLRSSRLPNKGIPPSSMIGQFSSKESSNKEKNHKCKVCDKRFTLPSSLQTRMYSHAGEKPFSCDAEGCGPHFSVIFNLRRRRKVQKGEAPSEAGSKDWLDE
ncbi:hypothetical protein DL95DRAFT_489859 [Leptodontidium sp. 2 PMI_412]|nr:hypothetical protein DL95DRAFT_489859 [Leptodontidium sp. 2 PMI_412]